jgi:indole-3-glycerol phosphate synthase
LRRLRSAVVVGGWPVLFCPCCPVFGRPHDADRLAGPVGFLSEFMSERRRALAARRLDVPALEREATGRGAVRPFAPALRRGSPAIVAEVKRASPSAGDIAPAADPSERARAYVDGGASAVSVLTESLRFGGTLDDLRTVRDAVDLPLLRKDFLVAPVEVLEARAAGADAVLAITAALSDDELAQLLFAAEGLDMAVLVEAHGDEDLERALATGAPVIGVNARDLESLEVDLDAALARVRRIPPGRVVVLESGVSSRAHVQAAVDAGASAILVGEALMRAEDPRALMRELRGEEPSR